MKPDKRSYHQSVIVSVVIMGFALTAFLFSIPMPGNAPIFPRMASIFLFLCGLALLIDAVRRNKEGREPHTEAVDFSKLGSPLVIFVLAVVYALGLQYIGFYVTTLAVVIIAMTYMGIRSVKVIALVNVILLAFLYWLFTIQLSVPMPRGILM